MAEVRTLVITGYGTNCEDESAYAARQAGSDVTDVVYFSDLEAGHTRITNYNFIIFPGGFMDGDDMGSAQAGALRWKFAQTDQGHPLVDDLKDFMDNGGIMLGICNGFQLMVKLGLLPAIGGDYFERQVSLAHNESARFEDRWVTLKGNPDSPCVFTKGIDTIQLPIRHGEGRLVAKDDATMKKMMDANLHCLQYVHPDTGDITTEYPFNPNGSPYAIAGLTDPTGRFFGLMPHPEAFNHPTNHPTWTRNADNLLGTTLLKNGVNYLKSL